MKDDFFRELLAQLDAPERHFEYKPSSILAISASNERPTSEELRAARHAIESASADRVQYAGLILRLESVLDQARKGLAQVDRHLEAHKSVLAPIRGLPAELLLEIFRLTFSFKRGYGFNLTSYLRGPWVLSHVCRCWRDVVVGCPTLWSSFTILFASRYTGNLLTLSLSRSQRHPLSFFLSLDDSPHDMARYRATHYVYRTLVEHSNRWEDVEMHVDRSLALSLPHAKNKLDILRKVEVIVINEKERTAISDLFTNAPKLKHVTLISGFPRFAVVSLPWSQLSSLFFSSVTLSRSCIEALGSAVVLERLTVRCCHRDEISYSQTETACVALLPALRYLTTGYPRLFTFLHLPAVEELICYQSLTSDHHPEFLWDMFCQGRPALASLTSLTIFDNRTIPKYMLLVLPTLLSLERLKIEVTGRLAVAYLNPILLRLRSQPLLLPRLRAFSFEESYDADGICQCPNLETGTLLVDVIYERQGVLKSVYLQLNVHIAVTSRYRRRLQTLEDEGLDLKIVEAPPPEDESEEEEEALANATGSHDSDDDSNHSSDDSE